MEEAYQYSKERFDEMGFLSDIPEERKKYITHVFNFVIKWVVNEAIVTGNDNNFLETSIIPVFYRITKKIDLSDDEILKICNELKTSIITNESKSDVTQYMSFIDYESEFLCKFSEEIINRYKK